MRSGKNNYLSFISVLLLFVCLPSGFVMAEPAPEAQYVPTSLIEKAAEFYANQRWSNPTLISITPYYGLDGTPKAYAAQFAKQGQIIHSETQLAERVAIAEKEHETIGQSRRQCRP